MPSRASGQKNAISTGSSDRLFDLSKSSKDFQNCMLGVGIERNGDEWHWKCFEIQHKPSTLRNQLFSLAARRTVPQFDYIVACK